MLSHLKERKQRNGKIEKYCKNPLVCPLKITCSDGWRRKGGGGGFYNAEMKEQSIFSFLFTVLQREIRCSLMLGNPHFLFKDLH